MDEWTKFYPCNIVHFLYDVRYFTHVTTNILSRYHTSYQPSQSDYLKLSPDETLIPHLLAFLSSLNHIFPLAQS